MNSVEKLQQLSLKVERLIKWLEQLRQDNKNLQAENAELKNELSKLRDDVFALKQTRADQSQIVKTRLSGILDRLEELEQIG